MTSELDADLAIIGAGPTGLYAAFCAGFRELSTVVVDALPTLGGQVSTLYPEKVVRDVAGIPAASGRELVEGLVKQAEAYAPTYLLGCEAKELEDTSNGTLRCSLADGGAVRARSVIITTGIGAFAPRPIPTGGEYLGRGLSYFVTDPSEHAERDVVIVGGGDSAVDWALTLVPIARSVTLVHRRRVFRAHAASLTAARAAGVRFYTDCQVRELAGDGWLESVRLTAKDGTDSLLEATSVVAALGFVSDLGAVSGWGLDLSGAHIRTDSRMRTNRAGVYAAGDVADYEGKVRLMSVGFGEAATAVNNAAVGLDPTLDLMPGHSTDQ